MSLARSVDYVAGADLDGFEPVPAASKQRELHEALWGRASSWTSPLDPWTKTLTLPEANPCFVRQHIALHDHQSLEGPTIIRYLDLDESPMFRCFSKLKWLQKVVVREEYYAFLQDLASSQCGYLWTGQPGIGKSVGNFVLAFCLIALGQPFFLQLNIDRVLYFATDGVFTAKTSNIGDPEQPPLEQAASSSLYLIDLDGDPSWLPQSWVWHLPRLVWSTSPNYSRWTRLFKQSDGKILRWHMLPWDDAEIKAFSSLTEQPLDVIMERKRTVGPVPRALFLSSPANTSLAKVALDEAAIAFLTNPVAHMRGVSGDAVTESQVSHRLYMVLPAFQAAPDGSPIIDREQTQVVFLSDHIAVFLSAKLEVLLMKHREVFDELTNVGPGQPVAGYVLKGLVHRRISGSSTSRGASDLATTFGLTSQPSRIDVSGTAEGFVLQPRLQGDLHIVPVSKNFPAADSMLVTNSAVYLLQVTVSPSHSHGLGFLFAILARLADFNLASSDKSIHYCIVGMDSPEGRIAIKQNVDRARNTLESLRTDSQFNRSYAEKNARFAGLQDVWLPCLQVFGCSYNVDQEALMPIDRSSV